MYHRTTQFHTLVCVMYITIIVFITVHGLNEGHIVALLFVMRTYFCDANHAEYYSYF